MTWLTEVAIAVCAVLLLFGALYVIDCAKRMTRGADRVYLIHGVRRDENLPPRRADSGARGVPLSEPRAPLHIAPVVTSGVRGGSRHDREAPVNPREFPNDAA